MAEPFDLLVAGGLVVAPGAEPFLGDVGVRGSRIEALLAPGSEVPARRTIDATGRVVVPGVIDPHVHYNYRYTYRDTGQEYDTESASALVGGVTMALRMHRDMAPYEDHVGPEIERVGRESRIPVAIHLAAMTEEQVAAIPAAAERYGITSFKLFMAYRGRAGALQGIVGLDDGLIFEALRQIATVKGGIACVHAENSEVTLRLGDEARAAGRDDLAAWADSRPGWTEAEAISRVGRMAAAAGCPIYIVHVSSAAGASVVRELRSAGVDIHAETCAHYLTETVEATSLGLLAKVNPPIRSAEDVEALWDAVADRTIDTIGTDHVAHTRAKAAEANPTIWDVMPGFAGSATLLPAVVTYGLHTGRIDLPRLVELLSWSAARIFGLEGRGQIRPGAIADLAVVDTATARTVDASGLRSAADYSIYERRLLTGWPSVVVVEGRVAFEDGRVLAEPGDGRYLRRAPDENARRART